MKILDVEAVFRVCAPAIDDVIERERANRSPLAMLVQVANGRVQHKPCGRDEAVAFVLAHPDLDAPTRERVAREIDGAHCEMLSIVLVAPPVALVRAKRRDFVPLGFVFAEEQKRAQFLVDALKAKPDEQEDEWLARYESWAKANPTHPHALHVRHPRWQAEIGWAIRWALEAFQRVQIGDKKAAELMGMDPGDDPDTLLCKPWHAYTIEISDELVGVPFEEGIVRFGVVCVWHRKDGLQTALVARSRTMERTIVGPRQFPLAPMNLEDGDPSKKPSQRAVECIAALSVGVELTMSDPKNVKPPKQVGKAGKSERGAPSGVHRIIAPVTVDCREHIADYIAGRVRTGPKTKTFVRGYWKRVVHGKGRALRTWREFPPGWRNPQAERVAIRPHRLGAEPHDDEMEPAPGSPPLERAEQPADGVTQALDGRGRTLPSSSASRRTNSIAKPSQK